MDIGVSLCRVSTQNGNDQRINRGSRFELVYTAFYEHPVSDNVQVIARLTTLLKLSGVLGQMPFQTDVIFIGLR